jgi:outer membrane murein-binding lipoprotein Lpp
MKIKTILVVAAAAGAGYVLGTRAGRAKFDELKARASEFAHSPQAQEAVSKVADLAKQNAGKLPDPLADAVTSVADSVQHKQ